MKHVGHGGRWLSLESKTLSSEYTLDVLPPGFEHEVVPKHPDIDSFKGAAEEELWQWGENSNLYASPTLPPGKNLVPIV
jgi:hypothetical protein